MSLLWPRPSVGTHRCPAHTSASLADFIDFGFSKFPHHWTTSEFDYLVPGLFFSTDLGFPPDQLAWIAACNRDLCAVFWGTSGWNSWNYWQTGCPQHTCCSSMCSADGDWDKFETNTPQLFHWGQEPSSQIAFRETKHFEQFQYWNGWCSGIQGGRLRLDTVTVVRISFEWNCRWYPVAADEPAYQWFWFTLCSCRLLNRHLRNWLGRIVVFRYVDRWREKHSFVWGQLGWKLALEMVQNEVMQTSCYSMDDNTASTHLLIGKFKAIIK